MEKPKNGACVQLQTLEKKVHFKSEFCTILLKNLSSIRCRYVLLIFVLKYNLRQLNINSCLLSYKNIYKNRVFKGGGYSY